MEKLSFAQKTCVKKSGLALQKNAALWPGCRIGIAVSGGVDSFALLKTLKIRQKIVPFAFEIMALHINPGFAPQSHAPLAQWLRHEGIAGHLEISSFGPTAHSEKNRKGSPCFYCAMLRRKRLFDLAASYKLTHLALGHNAEDLMSTFLLNLLRLGRVDGMTINASFFNGSLRVIRPLLLVEKKYIRQAARQWNLPVWTNSCPSAGHTARAQAEKIADLLSREIPGARRSLINALIRWQLEKDTAE